LILFGYANRTSFLTAVSLAQISEFGLIIAQQGLFLGHISQEILSLIVVIAILSIATSTYYIKYDNKLFQLLAKVLKPLEFFGKQHREIRVAKPRKYSVLVVGCDRVGYGIVKTIKKMRKRYLVVDYNPEVIKRLMNQRIPCLYGDIGDIEILDRIRLPDVKMIVSTIPVLDLNSILLKVVRRKNKKALVFLTANNMDEALSLYERGADYVILPHFLGGAHVSVLMQESVQNLKKLLERKSTHIKELKHRMYLGHRHPRHH